jgi:hypothetical protein
MAKEEFNRQARRTALLSLGLVACGVFGVIVLAGGDWIPGAGVAAAVLIGLARQIPVIRNLCREGPAAAPQKSKPAQ